MNIEQLESYNLADAVKFNDRLNPILWGSDEQLNPEVREKLLSIADEFREFLGVNDLQLKDITISGSNAAYTYTPHSDIDLHLVVDLPEADRNEVYRELFDAKKYVFNDMHDIKIGGYDVELYVQDANKPHHSQGIYSVVNNDWVDVPKRRRTEIDDVSTQSKYEDLSQRIDTAIASDSYKQMSSLTEKIRDMRQAGLDEHGEFGPENLAFKMLRSQGKIKELYDARNAARDQELSLKERRTPTRSVFTYGFKHESEMAEDAGETWDGVNPTTCMFLNEEEPTEEDILTDFIDFCSKELKIEHMPIIKLRKDPQWPVVHKTFGRYINDKHLLEVAWGQRHIMDVLRTVAHELTHCHQHERDGDRMGPDAGETGSTYENEANARAGILMRDYARLHPDYFAQGQAEELHGDEVNESASGYIPTKKQSKDPRWSMALTKDIRPGALGLNANKLKLNTNKQGEPQIANPNGVVQRMKEQLEAFKQGIILETEELAEVKMSPSALKKFAASPAAEGIMVGFEAELIVPDVTADDADRDMEPDYDADERCTSIQQVIEFFEYDEWGYGLSSRDAERLQEKLDEAYFEWQDEQMYRDFKEEAEDLIKKVMIDEKDWVQEDEVRKQLDMMEITGADQEAVLSAGSRAPTFKTTAEQQAYTEENPEYEKYVEALEQAEGLLDELVQDSVRAQDKYWDAAIDDFRDNYYVSDDSGFFDDVGLRYMSDVANRFDVYWPYMTFEEGEGSQDIDSVADSLSEALGMPVIASYNYHGATRKPGQFIVEPDGSLNPASNEDGGLEIISPPMPIAQAMEKLNQVIKWAQDRGCYTNSSTGLHMGVSLPGQKSFAEDDGDAEPAPVAEKPIDFMKLALFLGDQHVLKEFGRSANHYCASTLKKLKEKRWSPQQIATAMEKMRGNLINLAYKDLADRSPGRDSINMKDNYVEFRGAGGDYLSRESNEGMDFLENTLLRYVQALAIAGDPTAHRDEYAKKLYKLISPEGDTTLDLFSKFATGEITTEQLKKDWAKKTLEKDDPSSAGKGNWVLIDKQNGKPVPGAEFNNVTRGDAYDAANKKYGEMGWRFSLEPANVGRWEIYRNDHGEDEQLEIIDAPTKADAVSQAYDTYTGVIPFRVRPYFGTDVVKPEPSRRAKLAKQIIQKPAQSKDYNYEIVNLGDVNLGVVDKFYATDKQDADATFNKWLEMKGLPNDTSNYGYRPRKQEPAQQTPPDATEQEGTWQLVDVTLNQPVETFQGTWADADRIANQYSTSPGEHNGHEISVRRA